MFDSRPGVFAAIRTSPFLLVARVLFCAAKVLDSPLLVLYAITSIAIGRSCCFCYASGVAANLLAVKDVFRDIRRPRYGATPGLTEMSGTAAAQNSFLLKLLAEI